MLPATQMDLIGIHYQQRRGLEGIHFDRKSPDGTAHFFPNCAIYPDKCALFCALPTKLRKLRIYLRIGTAHNRNTKDCAILINPLCDKPLEGNLGGWRMRNFAEVRKTKYNGVKNNSVGVKLGKWGQ